jgi:hypothetical protein
MGLTLRSRWSQRRHGVPGCPTRPCHKRAIHSGLDRSRADNNGQRKGGLDLQSSSPSQVMIPPELALQAGVSQDGLNPRTGQHSKRFRAYSR